MRAGAAASFFIVLVTFAAFFPALFNGFVDWDDSINLVNNPFYRGLDLAHLKWMFTTFHMGHYIPLTWLSFALDYEAWGLNPFGYHLTSLILHCLNAVLFYRVSRRLLVLGKPGPADRDLHLSAVFAALLFSMHPLRVESVAWATERRDVLSGFFYLLAILAYLKLQEAPVHGKVEWTGAALGAFVLSLLSKEIAITLPLTLALLDVYPLGRLKGGPRHWFSPANRAVWLEKIPFLAAAAAAAAIGTLSEWSAGHLISWGEHGFLFRAAESAFSLVFYLLKTALPRRLLPVYEDPFVFNPWDWPWIASAGAVLGLAGAMIAWRRRAPALAAAGAYYLITIFPVLAFFKIGQYMAADRYTYLPCLGWAALAGAGLRSVLMRSRRLGPAVLSAGALVLLALGVLTWRQTRIWHDSQSLWGYALAVEPRQAIAHNNLGAAAAAQGRSDEALEHYRQAVRIYPDYLDGRANLGNALFRRGDAEAAAREFEETLRINPGFAEGHNSLGLILAGQRRYEEAMRRYRQALEIDPAQAMAHVNWGNALAAQGRLDEAAEHYREAQRLNPGLLEARLDLGNVLAQQGRLDQAVALYQDILRDAPSYAAAQNNLAVALRLKARGP